MLMHCCCPLLQESPPSSPAGWNPPLPLGTPPPLEDEEGFQPPLPREEPPAPAIMDVKMEDALLLPPSYSAAAAPAAPAPEPEPAPAPVWQRQRDAIVWRPQPRVQPKAAHMR